MTMVPGDRWSMKEGVDKRVVSTEDWLRRMDADDGRLMAID